MEFSTLCLNFKGSIDFNKREITYMNSLKMKYNENIPQREIFDLFQIEGDVGEIAYVNNVQLVSLFLNYRGTNTLVGFGKFYPNKWLSEVSPYVTSLHELEEMSKNYYFC